MVNLASFYQGPDDQPVRQAWVDEFAAALQQGDQGAYVGFLGDEGQGRVHQAYPAATWERLAAVKARYDPHQPVSRQPQHPTRHLSTKAVIGHGAGRNQPS